MEPSTPSPRRSNASVLLGAVAVVLAAAALVVSIALPGPTGPVGATGTAGNDGLDGQTGIQGPPGPGSLVVTNTTAPSSLMGTCAGYPQAQITITVPGAGDVIVAATVQVWIRHVAGTEDLARVESHDVPTGCNPDPYAGSWISVPANNPSDSAGVYFAVPVLGNYTVSAAGSHTFYVRGLMISAGYAMDIFQSARMTATFYPA